MEEKDIIGSILPNIHIDKINISNPTKEKISIEVNYSFYDSQTTQNTLWSSLPQTFKKCIKLVVAIVEDGPNLKKDLLTFLDTTSSQNLKFFHSSFKNEIGSIDTFKRYLDKNKREDITIETINGIEYRKYTSAIKREIDITNGSSDLNVQVLAYCYFDSNEFKQTGVAVQRSAIQQNIRQNNSVNNLFFEPVDYYGKFTYINVFTDGNINPEKITYINSFTGEEFLGQIKGINDSLYDFDTESILMEELVIPVEFVEDMRNYKFIKKNLKNIINEVNALKFKFNNVNNKLAKKTANKQYVSQLFLSKTLKQENLIPIFADPILEKPNVFEKTINSSFNDVGTFFFDYERFIKENSVLNRIKNSSIFIDPNFLQFEIKMQKKSFSKGKEYDKQLIKNISAKTVSYNTDFGNKNLLQVTFIIDTQLQRGNYEFSLDVYLKDNIIQQLLQNLKNLKIYLTFVETYSSIIFKNLDKVSNSVKTDSTQPTIYYDLLQNNFTGVFLKAITDIGIPLEEPIKSEDFNPQEKNAKKLLEEILISLKPENTNLETVYQFIELINSVVKEYSKFTDIFSNSTFNPHIETFFNITRGKASINFKHIFKELLLSNPEEKLFILTKEEIKNEKYNSNLFIVKDEPYFVNTHDFVKMIQGDELEEIIDIIRKNNNSLYDNKFEKILKELYPQQLKVSILTEFLGLEKIKEFDNQVLKPKPKQLSINLFTQQEKIKRVEKTPLEEYRLSLVDLRYNNDEEILRQKLEAAAKSSEANTINFLFNATKRAEYLTGFSVTEDQEYGSIINLGKPFWNQSKDNNNLLFGRLVNVEVDKNFFKEFKYSFKINDYRIKFTNEYFTTN